MKYGIAILAFGLFLLAMRYISVLVEGYDVVEGNNDPRADWVNYSTCGALGFAVARYRKPKWGALAGSVLAVVGTVISWLLIIGAWAPFVVVNRGWDFLLSQ
jgi:hypothetical protein